MLQREFNLRAAGDGVKNRALRDGCFVPAFQFPPLLERVDFLPTTGQSDSHGGEEALSRLLINTRSSTLCVLPSPSSFLVTSPPFSTSSASWGCKNSVGAASRDRVLEEGLKRRKKSGMGNCVGLSSSSLSPADSRPSSPGRSTSKTSSISTIATTGKLSNFSSSTFGQSTGSSVSIADEVFPEGRILEVPNLRIFTFAELRSATRGFKPEVMLGEGGFGRVYKGWVEEKTLNPAKSGMGTVVAVKKLNPESMQGVEEWQSEVNFLGRLSHPNLVKLLGYCMEDKELLLVYEYMPKGSLENHLFRRGAAFEPLSWSIRLKIAIGAARGLAFLHSSERQVIYRDFKASNILLDANFNAKLSDFGLAKHGPMGGESHVTTRVMGTYGYAAPEYVATGHLYVKSDVYGFGVVLLEMLSGQRAMDTNRPTGQHKLVDWAMPMLADRRKLSRLMDQRLEGQYSSKGAFQAAQLTLNCLAGEPKSRPSMKEVVDTLEKIEALKAGSRGSKNASRQQAAMRSRGLHSPLHPKNENLGQCSNGNYQTHRARRR